MASPGDGQAFDIGDAKNRGKLFPIGLCIYSYDMSEEKDRFLKYNKTHTIGKAVNKIDMNYWDVTDSTLQLVGRMLPSCKEFFCRGAERTTDIGFSAFFMQSSSLVKADISYSRLLTDNSVIALAKSCKNLTFLDVSHSRRLTDDSFAALGQHCTELMTLYASHCPMLADNGLIKLCEGCKQLVDTDLSHCPLITDYGLRELVNGCRELSQLKCDGNSKIDCSLFCVPALGQEMSCNLFISCQVRSFVLQGCSLIDDERLSWLAQSCMHLQSLDISNCQHVSTVGIDALSSKCTKLEALNVIGCGEIIDYAVCNLARNCPDMRALDLAGHESLSDASISFIVSGCLRLEYLNLSGLRNISDTVFVPAAEIAQEMESIKGTPEYLKSVRSNLRSLHLADAIYLSDASLGAIGILYSKLYVLDISNCQLVTNIGLAKLCKYCKKLKSLSASYCPRLSDKAVTYITKYCPDLETLKLSARKRSACCKKIQEKSLVKLLVKCLRLKVLEMSNRIQLTGKGIKTVEATDLRSLNISGCENVRPIGIVKLVLACPKLYHIDISKCKHMPRKFVSELYRVRKPFCEIGKTFRGIFPAENASLLRHQAAHQKRTAKENSSAILLQERWRGWLKGEFTLMYLIIWTKNLKRKADVERLATLIQKIFRGKLGRRRAHLRRKTISAQIIQKAFRAYLALKRWKLDNIMNLSAEVIQRSWKHYQFKCVSLVQRIRAAVREQRRREEIIRKRSEKLYFSARSVQQLFRCFKAKKELARRQEERRTAIYGSALVTAARMVKHIEMDAPDRRFFFRVDGAKRYPGRFCHQCRNAHATVICFGCGKDLCPGCDQKIHAIGRRCAHHPKRLPLRVKLPGDPRFEPPLQRAGEIRADWHELVLPIIKIQNLRYRTLAELRAVVAVKLEKKRRTEEKERKETETRKLRGIVRFQANVRRYQKKTKWLDLMDELLEDRDQEIADYKKKCAISIQSLYRGYSVRIWIVTLTVEDPRKFWYQVQTRKRVFVPSLVKLYVRESKKLRASFGTKLKASADRYRVKEKLWTNKAKNFQKKADEYTEESRVFAKKCKTLSHLQHDPRKQLQDFWKFHKALVVRYEIFKNGKVSQRKVNSQNKEFLGVRVERECRRDAVLTADGLALDKAFAVKDLERRNIMSVFDKLSDLEQEPEEEVVHSDEDPYDDSEDDEDVPAIDRKTYDAMTEEEKEEHRINAELERQDAEKRKQEKIQRKIKEKAVRQKYRIKRHQKMIRLRKIWLTKQRYKISVLLQEVDAGRLELAKHAYESAKNEFVLQADHEKAARQLMEIVKMQIQIIAEDMWVEADLTQAELMDGEGSEIAFKSITRRVNLRQKRRKLQDAIMEMKTDLSGRSADQVLVRERYVVPEWLPGKMKWKVQVRTARFGENVFDPDDWFALYREKPWGAHLKTDKKAPLVLRKQNKRFDKAIELARKKQDVKAEAERVAKAAQDRKDAIAQAKVDKKMKEQQKLLNNYGEVLAELLTEVSQELRDKRESDRRANKTRFERLKEDVNMFFNGDKIRAEEEMKRITASIRSKQMGNLGYIEGIESIKMIVGKDANQEFQLLQDELVAEEMPHWKRLSKTVDKLVVWYMNTIDNEMMITDIQVSHAEEGNFYFKSEEFRTKGYSPVRDENEEMDLIMWYRRVRDDNPLESFDVTFTLDEERSMLDDHFAKIKMDLGYAGLAPSTYFWQKKFKSRINKPEKEVTEDMVNKQIKGYKEILAQDPDNIKAQRAIKKLNIELDGVLQKKKQKAKNKLKDMVEFLAMGEDDVMGLMAAFKEMDTDDSGEVSLEEFFDYIDVDRSIFGDKLFSFLDESNDGQLDFPEFFNAVGTYCMFGTNEWLQFAFGMFDPHGNGYIMEPELRELLVTIHGDNPLHTGGVDRVMDVFDRNGDGKVEWDEFASVNRRYASMFMPIFHIQKNMQRNFLGQRYWNRKKALFVQVRDHMKEVRVRNAKLNKQRRLYEKMKKEREEELARIAAIQEEAGVEVTANAANVSAKGVPFVTKAQLARAAYNPKKALEKMAVANKELQAKAEEAKFVESRKGFNDRAAKRKEDRKKNREEQLQKSGKLTRRVKTPGAAGKM
jgi:Ca2+-binding EF-hand superfamily protein